MSSTMMTNNGMIQLIPPPQSPSDATKKAKKQQQQQQRVEIMNSSCDGSRKRMMMSSTQRTCSNTTATTVRNEDDYEFEQNNKAMKVPPSEISDVMFFDANNCSAAGNNGFADNNNTDNDFNEEDVNVEYDDDDDNQSFLSTLSEFSWGTTTKTNEDQTAIAMEVDEEEELSPTTSTTTAAVEEDDDDNDSWGSCAIPVSEMSNTIEDNTIPATSLSVEVEGGGGGVGNDDDDVLSYFSAKQIESHVVPPPPIVTMEQLVEETKTLSIEENESIIKDLYGKNHHHTHQSSSVLQHPTSAATTDTEDDDIASSLIDDFYLEVEKILADDSVDRDQKKAYGMALMKCPTIVDTESSPVLFLRRENYVPRKAAQRMLLYWQLRVEIFGLIRAFEPMTLDGALADDIDAIVKYPNLHKVLPDCDKQGRTVICFDKTNFDHRDLPSIKFIRYMWGVIHQALLSRKKPNGQPQQDIVWVNVIPSFKIWEHDSKLIKLMGDSLEKTIPIKLVAQHWFVNFGFETSFFGGMILPVILFIMGKVYRTRCQFYSLASTETQSNIERLEQFGLMRSGLPNSIPGCGCKTIVSTP